MPDQLEELFAELRTGTLPRVRPAGVDAARNTVRRRRTTKRVAAATALLTVAGGTAVIGLDRRMPELIPAASNETNAMQAVANLGDRKAGGLVADAVPVGFRDVPAGSYMLAVACAGSGVLTVRVALRRTDSSTQDLGGQVVSCATDPSPATMLFRLQEDGLVAVTVAGDEQARGNAAYAVALMTNEDVNNSPLPSQESQFNAQRAADLLGVSTSLNPQQLTTENGSQTMVTSAEAGEYSLRLACAGPGLVNFKMEELRTTDGKPEVIGATLADEAVDCLDEDPQTYDTLVTVVIPADAGYVVTVNPDEGARNQAGLAFVLLPQ